MNRTTRQREAILHAFRASGRPLSPSEALGLARRQVESVGQATVYRTVRLLVEEGVLSPVSLPGEPPRYELKKKADTHHHHFHCDACDRVYDIAGCPKGLEHMVPDGFTLRSHEIVLYGTCEHCGARKGRAR